MEKYLYLFFLILENFIIKFNDKGTIKKNIKIQSIGLKSREKRIFIHFLKIYL